MPETPRFSAALEEVLRRRAGELPGRRRRTRFAVAAAALVVVLAAGTFLLMPGEGVDEARATGLVFPSGRTTELDVLSEREEFRMLRDEFAAAGVEFRIRFTPVEPPADGRVFSIQYPDGADVDDDGHLVVEEGLGGPVVILVGRASERAERGAGLPIYEAIPELCALVDPQDANQTARALRDAGFEVKIKVLQGPPLRDGLPAPGTLVISLLDEHGRYTSVDPATKRLSMEVSDQEFEGHSGTADSAC